MPRSRIVLASVLLAASAGGSFAYLETHLNEITAPVLTYALARVAAIDALPAPTKAEKAERKKLAALVKTVTKTAKTLAADFSELVASGKTVNGLGASGDPALPALTEAFARADLALVERAEFVADHVALLEDSKKTRQLSAKVDAANDLRVQAGAEPRLDKRAKLLQKAETTVTGALKSAERLVEKADGLVLPPTRYRSGDVIGLAGGRLAIASGAASPLAGASLVFAPGALSNTAVTIGAGADIVQEPVLPAGPTLAVTPQNVTLNAIVTARVPYQLPVDRSTEDLAVFLSTGAGAPTQLPIVLDGAAGFVSASSQVLGSFQAGLLPLPTEQPAKRYQVYSLLIGGDTGTTMTGLPAFDPNGGAFVEVQTLEFRRNGAGSGELGARQTLGRAWQPLPPHHGDSLDAGPVSQFDFAWTQTEPGRMEFDRPLGAVTMHVQGVVSHDTNVVAWTGHTDKFDLLSVGVRSVQGSSTAQLEGRWVAVELGVTMTDSGLEPFRTVFTSMQRVFTVDANGLVTYDGAGTVDDTRTTYNTQSADPVHVRTTTHAADSGSEQWTIGFDGTLSDAFSMPGNPGRRTGTLDAARGILVSRFADPTTRTVRLAVAVKQPAQSTAPLPNGDGWEIARLELGQTAGTPTTHTSTLELAARGGDLDVTGGVADDALRAASRTVYTLVGSSGAPPAISWTLSAASSALGATTTAYAVAPDTAGNFLSGDGRTRYSMSQDGQIVIGAPTDDGTRASRGLLIGLR